MTPQARSLPSWSLRSVGKDTNKPPNTDESASERASVVSGGKILYEENRAGWRSAHPPRLPGVAQDR